ncbi:hypothetical protein Salat_1931000 [Sesamum alatum]|uniref:Uncharacterized protein n=1 Tax=Sesamum alatum TaxID=300844 RepID=A0AAE2CIL1_9LAMI|nr:hypothetical protein Salat_1931000 [Sesamum alatum]
MRREGDNHHYNGGVVDENMIVLRMRIHEMKRNYEAPMEWTGWEKRVYPNYDSMICDTLMWLQCHLMETRPGVALGMVALVALSVPTSTAVVLIKFLELIKGFHLS